MKFKSFILFFFIILPEYSFSEDKPLLFNHLTTSDGLANNTVHHVYQDRKGFIWIGTDDGLNVFNGYDFYLYKYNSEDSGSLSSNTVFKILEDTKGQIWLAASDGVDIFNREYLTFKHIPFYDLPVFDPTITSQYRSYTRAIIENRDGRILVANTIGVFIYDTVKQGFVRFLKDIPNYSTIQQAGIRALLIDRNNRIWIGSLGYGIFGYDLTKHKIIASPDLGSTITLKEKIYSLAEDSSGNIWAGTENGVFIIKSDLSRVQQLAFYPRTGIISSNIVLDIFFENDNNVWIGTDGGLILYKRNIDKLFVYSKNEYDEYSLNNNSVQSICKDKQGILWLGTAQGGINYTQLASSKKFKLYRNEKGNPNSISYNAVSAVFQDSEGKLWIGTDGGGLNSFDPTSQKFVHYVHQSGNPNSISGNSILAIAEDAQGRIWIGGYLSGINIIDKKTGKISRLKHNPDNINSISNDDIRDILFDDKERVWIATNGGGLDIIDMRTNKYQHFNEGTEGPVLSNWCIELYRDSKGLIWIGTYSGLIICDPEKMTFQNYNKYNNPETLSNDWVYAFAEDKKGDMWIGTANGLNYFERSTGKFQKILPSDGLPNEVINGILIDKANNLWLSTNNGIAKYNYAQKKFKIYTIQDGLQGVQYIHGAYFKNATGEMFFGGLNGLNSFYPEEIQDNKYIPDVYLSDLLIFYKNANINVKGTPLKESIETAKELILTYAQSVVTFKYAALNFISPEKNQYAYKLDGFDADWNYVGSRREATYTKLSPGSYVFTVKASNDDDVWNETGTSIIVKVLPPWWQTLLFRIALGILIAGLLISSYFLRINNLKNQKDKLEKLVEERTSEIREANIKLYRQANELSEINTLLEEKQQHIEQQSEILRETNLLLRERQGKIEEQTEELMSQKEELEKVNVHLNDLNLTKDKLFSIIAHDLKNPFGSILGFSELLMLNYDQLKDEKKRNYIKVIHEASENVYNLLENLLLWARSQTNRIVFEPSEFNLNLLIEDNINLLRSMFQNKNIEVEFNQSSIWEVYADKNMINTIIRNILSNAIKFSHSQGRIAIAISKDTSGTIVAVKDNGVGMTQEQISKLFSGNTRISREGTAGESGTGLGLILCKEFIEKHQGKLWIESIEGSGSTFYFSIPLKA